MPRRTSTFIKLPWNGGLNSSIDSGVLNDNDLVIADNVIFTTSGSRLKREGMSFIDTDIPSPIVRSSSSSIRTLIFADAVEGDDDIFVPGELVTITSTGSEDNYTEEAVEVLDVGTNYITYVASGAFSEGSTSTSTLSLTRAFSIINIIDYWRFSSSTSTKEQLLLAASDWFKLYEYNEEGERREVEPDVGATTPEDQQARVTSIVIENKAIFAFDTLGDTPIKYNPDVSDKYQDLGGSPPDFSIMAEHLGRLWTNDKTDPDRLHYSSTGNVEEWNGSGDSGAIDVSPGDGDSRGITGIYAFKGILFVAKGIRLFKITGFTPEEFFIEPVSNGIGIESPQSIVAVDQDDVVFVSKRGIHSTMATDAYGDTESKFLSLNIQNDFNTFEPLKLEFIQGTYIPELNSLAFSISQEEAPSPNDIWLYNVLIQQWYRWPELSCTAISRRLLSGRFKLLIGTNEGRICQAQNGTFMDFDEGGIFYKIKTGTIYPGGNPESIKGFKRVGFAFRPEGSFQFTCVVKIDNYPSQSLSFVADGGGDLLGETFILGSSILGGTAVLSPFMKLIDGHGRGITIEVTQSGSNQTVELLAYLIEYVEEDIKREVI